MNSIVLSGIKWFISWTENWVSTSIYPPLAVDRGVRNSKESRTLARESILESQIRIKNHWKWRQKSLKLTPESLILTPESESDSGVSYTWRPSCEPLAVDSMHLFSLSQWKRMEGWPATAIHWARLWNGRMWRPAPSSWQTVLLWTGHHWSQQFDHNNGHSHLQRRTNSCEPSGCAYLPYALGKKNFYGRGPSYCVDTTKPFTIVTRFISDDGTDTCNLKEIQRFYKQNGRTISNPTVSFPFSYLFWLIWRILNVIFKKCRFQAISTLYRTLTALITIWITWEEYRPVWFTDWRKEWCSLWEWQAILTIQMPGAGKTRNPMVLVLSIVTQIPASHMGNIKYGVIGSTTYLKIWIIFSNIEFITLGKLFNAIILNLFGLYTICIRK